MPISLASQSIVNAGASCSALLRGPVIVAAAYYFFGYWFSRRRV